MAAVSRVLSGDKTFAVRPETRQRINDVAQELSYRPNPAARGLRVSQTFSLGAVIPELDNPVHARIVLGAERAAAELGYSLIIAHRDVGMSETAIYERLVRQNRVDGLIVTTLQDEKASTSVLKDLDHPFMLVNRKAKGVGQHVVINDRGGAKKAVDFLVSLGHRRIAHLAGAPHRYNSSCRLQGYKDGLREAGLPFEGRYVAEAGYTQGGGAMAMQKILDSGREPPTAVFATTLLVAAGAMSTLRKEGITVPEEMSVIGFNDGAIAEILAPPLTTIWTPLEQMGYRAAAALIGHIEDDEDLVGDMLQETRIIDRASTSPILDSAVTQPPRSP